LALISAFLFSSTQTHPTIQYTITQLTSFPLSDFKSIQPSLLKSCLLLSQSWLLQTPLMIVLQPPPPANEQDRYYPDGYYASFSPFEGTHPSTQEEMYCKYHPESIQHMDNRQIVTWNTLWIYPSWSIKHNRSGLHQRQFIAVADRSAGKRVQGGYRWGQETGWEAEESGKGDRKTLGDATSAGWEDWGSGKEDWRKWISC